jgi:hypothetical protein
VEQTEKKIKKLKLPTMQPILMHHLELFEWKNIGITDCKQFPKKYELNANAVLSMDYSLCHNIRETLILFWFV